MRSAPRAPDAERATEAPDPDGAATVLAPPFGGGDTTARSEEGALVDALTRGEPWAAEAIWDRHATKVRRLMARALGPRPEIDDLTQEVFMRVFSRIRALRDPGALREFIIAVAVNLLKVELRRRWVRRRVLLSDDGSVPDVEAPRADPEAREALARCYAILDRLRARERAAFVLRYMEERTLEEVAAALGVSMSTAKRTVTRAAARVAKHVGSDEGLRSFFDRGNGPADRPPASARTTEQTSTKSNVSG